MQFFISNANAYNPVLISNANNDNNNKHLMPNTKAKSKGKTRIKYG